MEIDIIESNEEAYKNRYGISLREQLKYSIECGDISIESIGFYESLFKESGDLCNSQNISWPSDAMLLLLCGFSDGTYIRRLFENISDTTKILLYEPDEASFLYCCCTCDISDILSNNSFRIVIYDEKNETLLEDTLKEELNPLNIDHISAMTAVGYESFYNEIYEAMLRVLKQAASEVSTSVANVHRFKDEICRNEIFALSIISNNYLVTDFIQRIPSRNIPVIIVAAGPSLRKNAGFLKLAKGKALIIAVSHAVGVLGADGIMPDFVAVADPLQESDYMLHDYERKYRLIVSSVADRRYQANYNGKLFFHSFSKDTFDYDFIQKMDDEISTGSVATDMFSLFLSAGFKNFILTGQDLAYGSDGKTHATGEILEIDTPDQTQVKGINGEMLKTRQDWLGFKSYYENQIHLNPEITVIDATEGGAYIDGTRCMSLNQAIEEFCHNECSVDFWLQGLPNAISKEEELKIKKDLLEYADMIDSYKDRTDAAIQLNLEIQAVILGKKPKKNNFTNMCASYDRLYHELLDDNKAVLILRYMAAAIAKYNENAMFYEQNQDIPGRLSEELLLFKAFRNGLPELKEHIITCFSI